MSIDVKNTGLGTKIKSGASTRKELNWADEDLAEGAYKATLSVVYPWKSITKDTTIKAKDDSGRYIRDENGDNVKIAVPNLTWHYTDVIFELEDSGLAVKGSLSTHPDTIGTAKKFLYNADLFDVTLEDLKDHIGSKVTVYVKLRTNTYVDKNTGATVSNTKPYVSYYLKYDSDLQTEETTDTDSLGI